MEYVSNLTSKGQVTIPVSIRKALGLKPRDKVAFRMENGTVRIQPARASVRDSAGTLSVPGFRSMKQLRRETEQLVAEQALKRAAK